jgi:hypothetical protein
LSDSTSIAYKELKEVAKYVDYKPMADSLIISQALQLQKLEFAYNIAEKRLNRFTDSVVPTFKSMIGELEKERSLIKGKTDLENLIYEEKLRKRRGNFWKGTLVGVGLTSLTVLVLSLVGGF